MNVYIVMSHNGQNVEEKEIEIVTLSEEDADEYMGEMDDCCTQARHYWIEVWEV